ncbi:MAG: carbon-nitrogen hydrolase family protein [Methanobrevibacter sp.]|jgi:predicted amidohydrolase|nr:carbon-nitrogen hydrolase family protein [Methanobrevibacter sp.]
MNKNRNKNRNKIKIAMCQMKVVDNKEVNIKKAIEMINRAKANKADIAILPEMFNCPYENEKFVEYGESYENSPTLKEIAQTAEENNIHVLAGSIPEIETTQNGKKKIYNSSFLFDDKGELITRHRKLHLFDIDIENKISFKESETISAGDKITIAKTKFGKIGIAICYDIRFPELSRAMTLKGAKILIIPGAFNLTTGPAHWELLFRARALDNQLFTIGTSPALNKNSSYHAYGHSIICNPFGEVIVQGTYDEELLIAEIDLNEINKVKEELPLLKHRRTDLYQLKY